MQSCPNCKKENPDQEAYCFSCGHILPSALQGTLDATSKLEDAYQSLEPRRRWGTAYFGMQNELQLHFRDLGAALNVEVNGEVVVGRAHDEPALNQPDVDLTPYDALDQGVSRRHLIFKREHDTITVMDLGSANNTYLNGQRLIPHEPRILRDNDELRLGRLVIRVSFV
jgi:hypothetical protein